MPLQFTLSAADRKKYPAVPDPLVFERTALDEMPGSMLEEWEAQFPPGKSIGGVLIQDYPNQTSFGRRAVAWLAWNLTSPETAPRFNDFDPATSAMRQKLVAASPPVEAPSSTSLTGAESETSGG